MKVTIHNEQQLITTAEEAIKIIANLRKFTKLWEEGYGVELRNRKKYWESQADRFIELLQMPELNRRESIKIEINAKTDTTQENKGMEDAA